MSLLFGSCKNQAISIDLFSISSVQWTTNSHVQAWVGSLINFSGDHETPDRHQMISITKNNKQKLSQDLIKVNKNDGRTLPTLNALIKQIIKWLQTLESLNRQKILYTQIGFFSS
jgi:hypothetical protein